MVYNKKNLQRIKNLIFQVLERLPDRFKFKFDCIQYEGEVVAIILFSPDNIRCAILIMNNEIRKISDKALMGAFAHELAHYWIYIKSRKIFNDYMKVNELQLEAIKMGRKGNLKKAIKNKTEADKLLENKKIRENCKKYLEMEEETDIFAKERLGFKLEIHEMLKIIEHEIIPISLRFLRLEED